MLTFPPLHYIGHSAIPPATSVTLCHLKIALDTSTSEVQFLGVSFLDF